jgi:hypothetical protein
MQRNVSLALGGYGRFLPVRNACSIRPATPW